MSNTALSAAALATSISASQSAHDAEALARCSVTMPTYAHATATIEQAQEYATCVHLAYPAGDHEGPPPMLVGSLVLAAIVGQVVGTWRNPYDRFMGAMLGLFAGPTIVGLGWLLFTGAMYALGL